jgi:hypothetical protein
LAVSVLFFVAPLTASKARSLRRKYKEGMAYVVDRAGDFVIAALVAAYGVEKLVSGLKPLSTLELPVSSHAAAIAIAVLVAVIARYLMETINATFPRFSKRCCSCSWPCRYLAATGSYMRLPWCCGCPP